MALTFQWNKHTRFYTLTNARNQNSWAQDITVSKWLIQCTCLSTKYYSIHRIHTLPRQFPTTAITEKNPTITIQTLKTTCQFLITIMARVQRAFYEQSIQALKNLNIPTNEIKKLLKYIHQIFVKYLTYLVLNQRQLHNKQTPHLPP